MPGYKDVRDAVRMLGVTRATVYAMKWRGEIDTIKVGKYRLVSEASIQHVLAKREG
jgi:cell division protein YceG involved in septum cleavage